MTSSSFTLRREQSPHTNVIGAGRCLAFLRAMLPFALLCLLALPLIAQDRIGAVQVRVSTDRSDWRYEPGQPVRFRIVAVQDGHALSGVKVSYRIGPEMLPPRVEQTGTLTADGLSVEGGTMNEPGFLRCIATVELNGKTYRGLATAAFRPEAIQPTQQDPADFEAFWAAGKAALAELPIDAKITPLPEHGNALADCYHVNLQNVGMGTAPSRFYGVLCEPKAPGKYPALLSVPGAGVRPYAGLAEMAGRGVITLQVGIHGIPVTMEPAVYNSLGAGALTNYNTFGLDHRDRYYYRRVYLGCVRANDFLTTHPKWDGANLAVTGGSQGGALAIITASLDPRVGGLAAYYPALSDVTGYLHNRAGGWPHMFRATDGLMEHRSPEKIKTSQYYDVVNFARRVRVPGLYTWGFNDETCPPTSMYSAYNVIPGQKKLLLALETGHNTVPEQVAEVQAWLLAFLKVPPAAGN
ncbi:MAG: acetylxylan esterase [Bryobacterales bacterium]|nr:acetylxylan esterase [Bryobacterales bacterium]